MGKLGIDSTVAFTRASTVASITTSLTDEAVPQPIPIITVKVNSIALNIRPLS